MADAPNVDVNMGAFLEPINNLGEVLLNGSEKLLNHSPDIGQFIVYIILVVILLGCCFYIFNKWRTGQLIGSR